MELLEGGPDAVRYRCLAPQVGVVYPCPTMTHVLHVSGGFTSEEWEAARSWAETLDSVEVNRDLWVAHGRRLRLGEDARVRLAALPGPRRVLVLTEDWCGDAARPVPVLAAACEAAEGVEHRCLGSDEWPGVIERFLTHGGRAIPTAIVQDEHGMLLGAWGPRPAALQALVRAKRRREGPATPETTAAWYAPIMAWYGRDKGRSTVEELLMLLERGGAPR